MHRKEKHALGEIFRKCGIRLKSLGLKDASAITEQFVFTTYKTNKHFEVNESKYNLKKVGFTDKVLSKKEMIGNHFRIKIDGASNELAKFNEFDKILNFLFKIVFVIDFDCKLIFFKILSFEFTKNNLVTEFPISPKISISIFIVFF